MAITAQQWLLTRVVAQTYTRQQLIDENEGAGVRGQPTSSKRNQTMLSQFALRTHLGRRRVACAGRR